MHECPTKLCLFISRYSRPPVRPEPPAIHEPSEILKGKTEVFIPAGKRDILWKLARMYKGEEQHVPSWSAFNAFITDKSPPVAAVRYMPFIRASPTDYSTIYTALIRLAQLSAQLGQKHILVTADLGIYNKAQEILWSNPPSLDGKVTMRLGGMHITMAYIASIGKLYGDAGLLSILIESDVYGENTARQLLQGKHLTRGVRSLKLIQEALFRLFWKAMMSRTEQQGQKPPRLEQLKDVQRSFLAKDRPSTKHLVKVIEDLHIDEATKSVHIFSTAGSQQSATFAYWLRFMEGVDLLLTMLRAERDADFQLHLNCMMEVVPWFRAAGRNHYCKYIPVYVDEMRGLQQQHPESYKFLQEGGFVARRSEERSFNCVATDQALEQTINREGKSEGGVVGLTLKKGALIRWLMTRHVTTEYVDAMKELCSKQAHGSQFHHEHGPARTSRDEADIQKIMEIVETNQNPFDLESVPGGLVNIISGQVASEKVAKDLSCFLEDGRSDNQLFIEQHLAKDTRTKSFWATEKRKCSTTFADMKAPVPKTKSGHLQMDSEVLFRRLLSVSSQRDVSMENVLSHELAAVPPALFYDDGRMRKNTKADLAKKIESTVTSESHLPKVPGQTAYIIDGMALLQSLNESGFQTFTDLAERILKRIVSLLSGPENISCVAMVFDRYDHPNSIKQQERERRGAVGDARPTHIISGHTKVPNYRRFLTSSGNKAMLSAFVCNYITSTGPGRLTEIQTIILAGGFEDPEDAKTIRKERVESLVDLKSDQEEADTRIVLHAIHLTKTCTRVIIKCDDTDVLVLLLYYASCSMFGSASVLLHKGHIGKERFVPINTVCEKLGETLCRCLPACHALAGCDTTSSFFKIGKTTAFTKLQKHLEELRDLSDFGLRANLEEMLSVARRYALILYGLKKNEKGDQCATLDELRYSIHLVLLENDLLIPYIM